MTAALNSRPKECDWTCSRPSKPPAVLNTNDRRRPRAVHNHHSRLPPYNLSPPTSQPTIHTWHTHYIRTRINKRGATCILGVGRQAFSLFFSFFFSFFLLHFPSATPLPTMLPFPFSRISSSHMPIMTRTEVIVFCFTDREAGRIWIGALSLGCFFYSFLSLSFAFSFVYLVFGFVQQIPRDNSRTGESQKERKGWLVGFSKRR